MTNPETTRLTDAERTMLGYALDQAQERIWSEGGFTAEDQAAVDSLRGLAAEQPTNTEAQAPKPQTEEQIVREHVTTLHLIGEQLAGIESWMWNHLADVRDAERPVVVEQPDTQETRRVERRITYRVQLRDSADADWKPSEPRVDYEDRDRAEESAALSRELFPRREYRVVTRTTTVTEQSSRPCPCGFRSRSPSA